ncbi:hypothetical protein BDBG_00620 [Blastomyces gilchristii SLH14081]|uniref:Uncharacterized protein n=1 Tax=Blastomyces gilchristii (strain SLH14081) TaxID=559298 RepID=A0A179U7M4_BLAGS|nr:uncharacterized protein BDBG_00620 [Blastomyces gilchristii SLH14081]OAT03974.1 hypothetical protein BDBG_00620 [Blastomyces gilchristii SLH14081]
MKAEAAKSGVVRTGVAGAGEPDTGASVGDWGAAEEGTEGGAAEEGAAEGARGDAGDPATHDTGNSSIIASSKFSTNDSTSGSLSSADADLSTCEDSTQIKTNISASASTQNRARKHNQKPAEGNGRGRMRRWRRCVIHGNMFWRSLEDKQVLTMFHNALHLLLTNCPVWALR